MSTDFVRDKQRWFMDIAELSLAPPSLEASTVSHPLSEGAAMAFPSAKDRRSSPEENSCKKRKWQAKRTNEIQQNCHSYNILTAVQKLKQNDSGLGDLELHLESSLPADWEQCLDLKSGQMYYVNRSIQAKTWHDPTAERLDLDLNIASSATHHRRDENSYKIGERQGAKAAESSDCPEMVAIACMQCHMLVMLSKVSPSCPNCKYVHSLDKHPHSASSSNNEATVVRPFTKTLSLLD